jgi:uncharacterized protein
MSSNRANLSVTMPPVIDTDVHHTWRSQNEVLEYVSKEWRDAYPWSGKSASMLLGAVSGSPLLNPALQHYPHSSGPARRVDYAPSADEAPGTDYGTMKRQLLEPFRVARVILSFDVGYQSALINPWQAVDVVRAANDWNLEHWLTIDDPRLYSGVLVQTQVPEAAAAEIRRVGKHPKIAEVILLSSALGKPFGHPIYHPIYEAAAELGLPVSIHIGGELTGAYGHYTAGGIPNSRFELEGAGSQAIQHHVVSFITHGVFEKFPKLMLLLKEIGIVWIPSLLWNLDANYRILQRESPWVKRLPSDYFRDHVRVATQPIEIIPAKRLVQLFESYDFLQKVLCFSTDYPHWDTDDPTYVARRFPKDWLPNIAFRNALGLYGWDERAVMDTPASR